MSEFHTTDAFDPDACEGMLDGARTQVPGHGPVGDLLALAAAPGRPEELAGASTVMTAFRAAYPRHVARTRRRLGRALALKVGAVVAALTVGGVAFAAHSGVLPSPFPATPDRTAPVASRPGGTSASGSSPGASASPPASLLPSPSLSPSPAPNLHGMCRSFLATADKDRPKAIDSPKYAALRAAAAGQDLVTYCTTLLASKGNQPTTRPGNGPSAKATKAHPSAKPNKAKPKQNGERDNAAVIVVISRTHPRWSHTQLRLAIHTVPATCFATHPNPRCRPSVTEGDAEPARDLVRAAGVTKPCRVAHRPIIGVPMPSPPSWEHRADPMPELSPLGVEVQLGQRHIRTSKR
ncbi:hypothetical protein [Catellatospora bangladeshensis]|uniref:Uncharacterized protein n=1 Tax=Catellatospora bangladeshensis TaxID=310355 RepID=A0A8J3J9K4_9ACTN|nr:hypothetical protein [Catellatospora bangladeshensis]GIF80852.1 hypothetical protein Cba03nite_22010 [Catellatospora bangladeshensis]